MNLANGKPRVTKQMVAKHAIECFNRYGIRRTSMADIAEAMGVARQTVYRIFETRFELLEYIATSRVEALTNELRRFMEKFDDFSQVLVEGINYSIELGRKDDLLTQIIRENGDEKFNVFIFGGDSEVHRLMLNAFGSKIAAACSAGELAVDADDEDVIDWICMIGAMLNIRRDYGSSERRKVLETFVCTSLIAR